MTILRLSELHPVVSSYGQKGILYHEPKPQKCCPFQMNQHTAVTCVKQDRIFLFHYIRTLLDILTDGIVSFFVYLFLFH